MVIPQKYTGTKTVIATPMTRGHYNNYRGWLIPMNPADEGYLVEYTDDGAANHVAHQGYTSWLPKDVFERSYKPVQAPMYTLPHQQRVYEEMVALAKKLVDLCVFLTTPVFASLPKEEQDRLDLQMQYMRAYLEVLSERIAAFPG